MKRYEIVGTKKYEIHQITDKSNGFYWGVFSLRNRIYLKDATGYGRDDVYSVKRMMGLVFDDGRREKMRVSEILKLIGTQLN
ncbi:MAG: hypothetical protein ACRC6E_13285 [Fusobacteriaceae bacterium]